MIAADTPEATGEVADDTRAWVTDLLGHMDIEAEVKIYGDDNSITIQLKSESGGKLVGKRGRTLQAIQHLLAGSVGADHEDTTFRIDVADDRDRDGGRDRDRDRGGRGRDRDRDGGGRRDKRDDERNARKLKDLTSKIAVRVNETGEAEVIRKELNSYDRRLVHVAAKELGVGSRSIGEGNHKQIEIYRLEETTDDDSTEGNAVEAVEPVDAVETSEAEGAQA